MEVFKQAYADQGVEDWTADKLLKAWTKSTSTSYELWYQRWKMYSKAIDKALMAGDWASAATPYRHYIR